MRDLSYNDKVAFDIGNVLFYVDISIFVNKLVELGYFNSPKEGWGFWKKVRFKQDYGEWDLSAAIFNSFQISYQSKDYHTIHEVWKETIQPCYPMIKLVENLIEKNYKVAILSNIGTDHAKLVRDNIGVFHDCVQYFSCEVGAIKPELKFFNNFLKKYPEFRGAPFYDDLFSNVMTAKDCGLSSSLFDLSNYGSGERAAEDLEKRIYKSPNLSRPYNPALF